MTPSPISSPVRRGFVLVALAITCLVLAATAGLAVDLGRLFLIKTEAQSYIDAVALDAALQMDGTRDGLQGAAEAPSRIVGKWDAGLKPYSTVYVEFSPFTTGPWADADSAPLNSMYVRARTTVSAPLFFLPALTKASAADVGARAVSGQVAKTRFPEGWFPFTPFAHDPAAPHFGLTVGQEHTLRWAANPKLNGNGGGVCPGDRFQYMIDLAQAQGGSERGYYQETSASVIRKTVINDYMPFVIGVGDQIDLTGGAKQTIRDAIHTRINQDSDAQANTYAEYIAHGYGNGRRLVASPINDGGTPAGVNNRVVGIGGFFLLRESEYGSGGNQAWCAEYVGSWVQGSRKKGVAPSGAYVVRLIE